MAETTVVECREAIPPPMKAVVSCGNNLSQDGIEVSNISYSEEGQLQQEQQSHAPNSNKNEIRLYHSRALIEDDDDDEDDDSEDERELTFVLEDDIEEQTTDTAPQAESKSSTPPNAPMKKPREDVLRVISDLEKALENVDSSTTVDAKDDPSRALKRSSSSVKKSVLDIWRSISLRERQTAAASSSKPDEEDSAIATPKTLFKKSYTIKSSSSPLGRPRVKSGSSSWKRLKKSMGLQRNSRKQKGGEHALLLPKCNNNPSYSLPHSPWKGGVLDSEDHPSTVCKEKNTARHFFCQLLKGSLSSKNNQTKVEGDSSSWTSQGFDLGTDKTRSMSLEDDDDDDDVNEEVFTNDAELLDQLVTICDKTSSLELERGFSSLQERIRSRSFSRQPVDNDNSPAKVKDKFSSSFFDMPSLSSSHSNSSGTQTDPQNDSIPSFSSLQEFLSSVSDETNAASLEALLFEQELANLTTEELAELLDSELEKLMRDGFM